MGSSITDEEIKEAVDALDRYGTQLSAASALQLSRSSFQRRIYAAAERGLLGTEPVLPGYHIKHLVTQENDRGELQKQWIKQTKQPGEPFELPSGHVIKGVSSLVDSEGRVVQEWIKTKSSYNIDWAEVFKRAAEPYEGQSSPIPIPPNTDEDFLNLIPANDWHVNMLCWEREVAENWDLKIAERVIGEAMQTVIASARPAGIAIVLGGGDLMHNDDNTNRTAKSGNVLDADGRHQKGMEVTLRLMVRTVDAALIHNKHVIVRILKGNHDEQSSVAISYFLYAWYKNNPRVTVDLDQSLFWWYRFGRVMLGATHGHTVKLREMPQIMAHRRAEDWGQTRHRYIHGFHIHHKEVIAKEDGGAICESHQAPIPQDAWHYGSGYLSGRSVQVITYHKEFGEYGRRREPIPDALVRHPKDFMDAA